MSVIIHNDREQWLLARRRMLTASDAAAVLGEDPWRSALSVYAEKTGGSDDKDSAPKKWGRRFEAGICEGYEEETGRKVVDPGPYVIQRHPDIPWLGATLDRFTSTSELAPAPARGDGVLDAKAVASMKAQQWEDQPPDHYQIQVQLQMACTGTQWGSLCALIGGMKLVWKDLVRSQAFLDVALPKLEEFWWRVQRKEPPPVTGHEADGAAVRALYPRTSGSTVALDHADLAMVEEWERATAREKECAAGAELAEARLRAKVGAAAYGALPDGSFVTLFETENPGYTRVVKPYRYRVLRRWWPRLRRKA